MFLDFYVLTHYSPVCNLSKGIGELLSSFLVFTFFSTPQVCRWRLENCFLGFLCLPFFPTPQVCPWRLENCFLCFGGLPFFSCEKISLKFRVNLIWTIISYKGIAEAPHLGVASPADCIVFLVSGFLVFLFSCSVNVFMLSLFSCFLGFLLLLCEVKLLRAYDVPARTVALQRQPIASRGWLRSQRPCRAPKPRLR